MDLKGGSYTLDFKDNQMDQITLKIADFSGSAYFFF